MLWVIIIILGVALDQITKYIVINNIEFGEMIPVIDKFFYLTYHENKGAAWGILQNGRYFFIALTAIVSAAIAYALYKSTNRLLKFSLSLILAGAIGNFIDRLIKGSVADFLDFYPVNYHFPTFNAADILVTCGTALLAYYLIFVYQEPKKKEV